MPTDPFVTRYKKQEPGHVRGSCVKCGKNPQKNKGVNGKNGPRYKPLCARCDEKRHRKGSRVRRWGDYRYKKYRKDHCEKCGFIAVHHCQLDVDHIDGDHKNDDPANLQTLCANCHRLKTFMQRWGGVQCQTIRS